jgi:hypothetical protein
MKRPTLTALAVLVVACSNAPGIQLFTAGRSSIVVGESTQLLFAADAGAVLSIDQGIGSVTGRSSVTVSPTVTTTYHLTATRIGGGFSTASTTVTVGHGSPVRLTFDAFSTEVAADAPVTLTVSVRDAFGNVVTDYAGTLHFVLTDSAAPLVSDVAFTPSMQGRADVSLLFFTEGEQSILVSDTTNAALASSTAIRVRPGTASTYALSALPASAMAGEGLGLTIQAVDRHGNVVRNYAGTAHVSSSDPTDRLPADGGFANGMRSVSLAFVTAGSHFATVSEVGGTITANTSTVDVVPGAALFVVSFFPAAEAWAGTAANANVKAQDGFGNAITSYAGTITFDSSDAAAAKPGDVTLDGSQGGSVNVSVTFNTIGPQMLVARDTAVATITGSGAATVHGLVYTDPASGGKVRLIKNASSNASLVQLDLVSNATLFAVTAGTNDTIRNGVFAAGMNLPLDSTKVAADATLIGTAAPAGSGLVLNLGTTGTRAIAAALNMTTKVLHSGVSQRRTAAGVATPLGDATLRPFPGAASFYYSLRLRLTPGASAGTVFDGQALAAGFHAAVRDRSGTDVFQNADFAIGRLEVR